MMQPRALVFARCLEGRGNQSDSAAMDTNRSCETDPDTRNAESKGTGMA